MIEYYFLFALAAIYMLFASYEDIKKTEVANWITYSFAAFALAYRAIYSVLKADYKFFLLGVIGFVLFYLIGNLLYYAKALGGADVKLLRGIGVVLPYSGYLNLLILSFGFVILLFLVAFVYALAYSFIIMIKDWKGFVKEFNSLVKKFKLGIISLSILGIISLILSVIYVYAMFGVSLFLLLVIIPWLYVFLKAIDKCMIVLKKPRELMEGDWIINDIKLKGYIVKDTVHGLTSKDISMLNKMNKNIYVKNGVPFVPAILISFIIMVFFLVTLGPNFLSFLLY